jgi:single-stranded-DNA-specific exonuclease
MTTTAEWRLAETPSGAQPLVAGGFDPLTAAMLARRGVVSVAEAHDFLTPTLAQLHDPAGLSGMPEAVERIARAAADRERVVVIGDYDADGVTAVALLVAVLKACGIAANAILPHRLTEGYGFQELHVDRALGEGARLVITVDCGTTSIAAAERAGAAGLDVIVTDHHLPGSALPPSVILVNPRQEGCRYPFRDLAGVGLALKLAQAVARRLERDIAVEPLLRIAALGTIADLVPLRGENRVIAALGLAALPATKSAGLKRLFQEAGIKAPFDAEDVAFRIGPRLNAAGRLGSAEAALELLLTKDPQRADALAVELGETNRRRQAEELRVVEEATRRVEERAETAAMPPILVEWSEEWHPGVVGIAAGRLARRFHRPVLLLAVRGDSATGSGRSIAGIDLHGWVATESARLERFGGHAQAIGLTVGTAALEVLRGALCGSAERWVGSAATPALDYEVELSAADVDDSLWRNLRRFKPHGMANPEPLLRIGPLERTARRVFGGGHQEISARGTDRGRVGGKVTLIAWKSQELSFEEGPFEILGALERSSWNGALQIRVVAKRPIGPGGAEGAA